jgi:hypothetical protein
MMTANVKSMPRIGSWIGSVAPGTIHFSTWGRIRLSSQTTIEAMAQIVIPIGAKKTTPATK